MVEIKSTRDAWHSRHLPEIQMFGWPPNFRGLLTWNSLKLELLHLPVLSCFLHETLHVFSIYVRKRKMLFYLRAQNCSCVCACVSVCVWCSDTKLRNGIRNVRLKKTLSRNRWLFDCCHTLRGFWTKIQYSFIIMVVALFLNMGLSKNLLFEK